MTEESSVRIAKLSQDNYAVWCKQMMFLLTSKDLDETVLQEADWFDQGTAAERATKSKKDRKALAYIGLAIEPFFLVYNRGLQHRKGSMACVGKGVQNQKYCKAFAA